MKRFTLVLALAVLTGVGAVSSAETVRFAVVGDTQGFDNADALNEQVFSKIVGEVMSADPAVEFVVQMGDKVWGTHDPAGMAEEFQQWREIAKPWYESDFLGAKVYGVPGNHDQSSSDASGEIWQAAFPELPENGPDNDKKMTYSFDMGPCHIAVVNTSKPGRGHQVDLEWLANDLANSHQPIKLVMGHEPAYPMGMHAKGSLDALPELRDQFWQLLVQNGVKAYFCGHEHTYDHWIKDNVHQIITGGGGGLGIPFHYLIVEADENDVTVSLYAESDNRQRAQYQLSDTQAVNSNDRSNGPDPLWIPKLAFCNLGFLAVMFGFCGFGRWMRE